MWKLFVLSVQAREVDIHKRTELLRPSVKKEEEDKANKEENEVKEP